MDLKGRLLESSNDILMEILVRLPPKSIFKFMCVSTRWNNLIGDPNFIKRYDYERRKGTSGRLFGFIQCNTMRLSFNKYMTHPWISRHNFLSVSGGNCGYFPKELGYFITSSNGLFLCGRHPFTYHVGNPMTKRWVSLPSPPSPHKQFPAISVGLACHGKNDLELCYKVIVAGTSYDALYDTMPIATYSSITGEWTESILTAPSCFGICYYRPPTVIGGVFHWFTTQTVLAVYDSLLEERGDREKHLQLIELPGLGGSSVVGRTNDGRLWYGASNMKSLHIWVLPKEKQSNTITSNEWILVHTVRMDTLRKDLPITEDIAMEKRLIAEARSGKLPQSILYEHRDFVYLIAFIPWDPRLVLIRLRESIFFYDLESKTIDSVQLHGYPSLTDFEWEWYPYFDSLSLSSYALGMKQQQHIQPKM